VVFFMKMPGVWVPLLAEVDLPSFSGFPLTGLLIWGAFAALAAAGIASALWMAREQQAFAIPHSTWWHLGIGATLTALVIGTSEFSLLTIPAIAVVLPALVGGFARERDKLVPPAERVLTRDGLKRLLQGIRNGPGSAKPAAASAEPPKSMLDRARDLGNSLQQFAGKKKAAVPKDGPAFTLLKKDGQPALGQLTDDDGEDMMSNNVKNLQDIIVAAMKAGATDVHIEPHEKQYFVRFRIDGVLKNASLLSMDDGKGVISSLKVAADMDISERRRPQDGTFAAIFETAKYDVRAASTPTSYGEKMVLRLLNSSGGVMKQGLGNIGLRPPILEQLREVIHKPYGMFLVTGPTGSGKTTTVYASLSEIDAQQHNITTIEDPVEYRLDGITQIAVNAAADVTFASILRSVLRQDPDVLLVGEIRDKETAEIACQAALTGHFVFTTLHANDTVATITRLLDLGLDPMLIQTAVTAVLGQRLARRLCERCKEPYPPPDELLKRLGVKPGVVQQIYREKGCDACGGTGYKGRLGLHELMVMNNDIRKLITADPAINELKAATRKAGTRSLQTDGLLKVLRGLTSVNEVNRVTT